MGSRGASSGIEVKGKLFISKSDATPVEGYKRGELKFFVDINMNKHYDGEDGGIWQIEFDSHTTEEKEDAKWLEKIINEKVYLNPRATKPDGTPSFDYITESGIRIEQKTSGKGTGNRIERAVQKGKDQARIFLVNITGSGLSKDKAISDARDVMFKYKTKHYTDEIIIKDGNNLIAWLKK